MGYNSNMISDTLIAEANCISCKKIFAWVHFLPCDRDGQLQAVCKRCRRIRQQPFLYKRQPPILKAYPIRGNSRGR
jgi:hypothetical protein